MRARATIVVPTFNHGPLLTLAVESARRQTEQRLEIVIVGDGASPDTRVAAEALVAADDRIRFVAFPKDGRQGERYRHAVLRTATGEIVCYLSDDDLWMPPHVEVMLDLLTARGAADVATTLMVRVSPTGRLMLGPAGYVDLARPHQRRLFAQPTSGFASGLSCVAHTLAFYRSLPHGWRTTPRGIPTDGWMWKQLLGREGTRAVSRCRVTTVNFHSPPRRHWSLERRFAEMAAVTRQLAVGARDHELARLEAIAQQGSTIRTAWQTLWLHLHRSSVTSKPLMHLAKAVLNRPV